MSAGPLYTTENTVAFSGISKSLIDFYADQRGFATAQSGAQTIASGQGVLLGVIGLAGLLSGGGGTPTSQSGCTVYVIDAISGATLNYQSGASNFAANTAGVLYGFNFGTASGAALVGTGTPIAPPDLVGINAVFRSGLVAVVSGGVVGTVGISVLYSRGA
jgi:hypothetical protein